MFRILLFLALLASPVFAQTPRITEIMPVNATGFQDDNFPTEFHGWIEIWNPDLFNRVIMTGWKFTHGASTYNIPAIEIPPDERMVIFTSAKNRTNVTLPLHTNFTLSPTGGTLNLVNASNVIISSITYPAVAADKSFGRDDGDITRTGTYDNPTPEEYNNYTGTGVSGKVLFSVPSKTFTTSFIVTLTQETPEAGAVIRYTLDGSVPISSSAAYINPIAITSTTRLRARVFATGKLPGETDMSCYLQLSASTASYSSPLPICVISNFGLGTPPDNDDVPPKQAAIMWVFLPKQDGRARFSNPPDLVVRSAIDRRGSSTIGNAKWNLNFEARKARSEEDHDIELLGMPAHADWVFHAPFGFDRSLIHNPLAYAMSNAIGRYAVRTRMAEVFMKTDGASLNFSGGGSGDYFGIYNVMEKIRRGDKRVDVKKLGMYDNDATGKTGGYIWKIDRRDFGDGGFNAGGLPTDLGPCWYYPKEVDIEAPQRDPQEQYLPSYINSYKAALDGPNWTDPSLGYANFLDVPAAIDHHLVNVWAFNVDALRLSGYWSKERGGKLVAGPVWDFDRAFESTDVRDDNPAIWRSASMPDQGTDFFNYPWWGKMFTDPNFYQKYIDRWVELRRGVWSQASINALIDSLNNEMPAETVSRDLARWGQSKRTGTFPGSPTANYPGTQAGEIQRIKEWLQVRATFMESQWIRPVQASPDPGLVNPNQQVTLTSPSGAPIYYTLNGTDPRPSGGGAPGVGATLYTSPIVVTDTTRIKARAYNASWTALIGANNPPIVSKWSGLTDVRYSIDPPAAAGNIVISEVNYHPANPTPAELAMNPTLDDSDFEFIEIKNVSAGPVDLSEVTLSGGVNFTFPLVDGLSIPAGGFAIVAADKAAFNIRYPGIPNVVGNFPGDLSDGGEQIVLRAANGDIISSFTYDDVWYPATDGPGNTLARYNPTSSDATLDTAAGWSASVALNGSPGADEPNRPPRPGAGPDVAGLLPSINLAGTIDDDVPGSTVTLAWSKFNGPGDVTFGTPTTAATSATVTLPGVYTLRLSAHDGTYPATDDALVTMRDTPGTWLLRHPELGALNDDYDQDGRTNYYEWALNLDPIVAELSNGSTLEIVDGHLSLVYQRQKDSPFVTYTVQVTNSVSSWNDPLPNELTETIIADDGLVQTVRVTDNALISANPTRFLRLRVILGP